MSRKNSSSAVLPNGGTATLTPPPAVLPNGCTAPITPPHEVQMATAAKVVAAAAAERAAEKESIAKKAIDAGRELYASYGVLLLIFTMPIVLAVGYITESINAIAAGVTFAILSAIALRCYSYLVKGMKYVFFVPSAVRAVCSVCVCGLLLTVAWQATSANMYVAPLFWAMALNAALLSFGVTTYLCNAQALLEEKMRRRMREE